MTIPRREPSYQITTTLTVALLAVAIGCAAPGPAAVPPMGEISAWAIQLQGIDRPGAPDRLSRADVDLVVLDRVQTVRGAEKFPLGAVVKQVHASRGKSRARKLCLAYVNVGQAEDYRTYWGEGWRAPAKDRPGAPPFVLGADPEGWRGNYPVAYWDPAWRSVLFGGPGALVDGAIRDGFDGVVLDWVMGYGNADVVAAARAAKVDPAGEMVKLIRDLARYARERRPGFLVFPLNAAGLIEARPDLRPVVSGVVQEDVTFSGAASSDWEDPANADVAIPATGDWSTETHVRRLTALRKRGLTVLTVDYATTKRNRAAAESLARRHGFVPFVTRTPLDRVPDRYLIAR